SLVDDNELTIHHVSIAIYDLGAISDISLSFPDYPQTGTIQTKTFLTLLAYASRDLKILMLDRIILSNEITEDVSFLNKLESIKLNTNIISGNNLSRLLKSDHLKEINIDSCTIIGELNDINLSSLEKLKFIFVKISEDEYNNILMKANNVNELELRTVSHDLPDNLNFNN